MPSAGGASLCGPTNAFSALQKHATVDRTLQQNRIHAQPGPSIPQAFRSPLSAANLNREFQQFSSGAGLLDFRPPNWAAEFEQLKFSNTQHPATFGAPLRAHTWAPRPIQAPVPASASSWHTEFMTSTSVPQPNAFFHESNHQQVLQQHHHQQLQKFLTEHQQRQQQFTDNSNVVLHSAPIRTHSPSYYHQQGEFEGSWAPPSHASPFFNESEVLAHNPNSNISTKPQEAESVCAAFEAAFSEATRWDFEASQHDILDSISVSAPLPQQQEFAAVNEEGKGKEREKTEDADELSRTAGHLLESLAANQSKKFKESQFLNLMRRLRDKEVKVEGGDMVEVREG